MRKIYKFRGPINVQQYKRCTRSKFALISINKYRKTVNKAQFALCPLTASKDFSQSIFRLRYDGFFLHKSLQSKHQIKVSSSNCG